MAEFTGLLPDSPEQREERLRSAVSMPQVCYSQDGETRLPRIPSWMRRDDQGRRNSCAAHAGTNVLEKLVYMQTGHSTQLSRQFLYIEGQRAGGMRVADAGCTLYGITKASRETGVCTEDTVPYGAWVTTFPRNAYEEAAKWRLTNTVNLQGGYSAWRAMLGNNVGGVLMASRWPIEIRNGYASRYRPSGGGGHAYAGLFLADTSDANGRPDVLCLNSHSGNFEFKASATFVDELMGNDVFGIVGYTDMTTPAPRHFDWSERKGMV